MSFNNIEITRLRIQEAQQNGMRDAAVRRILAEQDGEQKVGWIRLIVQRWIEKKSADSKQPTAYSQQPTTNGPRSTAYSGKKRMDGRQWTVDS